MAKKWEYYCVSGAPDGNGGWSIQAGSQKITFDKMNEFFNRLGDQGWELVATTGNTNYYSYFFKRPKT